MGAVPDFPDAALFAMRVVIIVGLYLLMPVVKPERNSCLSRLEPGEIRKVK